MHVGLPPDDSFPLTKLSACTRRPDEFMAVSDPLAMSAAQQYIFGPGYEALLQWVRRLVTRCHSPQIPISIVMTAGAVHAISNIISVLADRGDTIIVDEFAYVHVTECIFIPKGLKMLPIRMDEGGMIPADLDAALSRATSEALAAGTKPPRLLYTVPTGHNPTSAILSEQRKRQIYQVCAAHDILILEDDAYYWLQFYRPPNRNAPGNGRGVDGGGGSGNGPVLAPPSADELAAGVPGLDLPTSFLSMDTEGRVIRVDTLSKLMGPGYRLGWVTCAPQLAAKLAISVQGNCVGPCSLSMVLLEELIRRWGDSRFEEFVSETQMLYRKRAEALSSAIAQHMVGLAEAPAPRAGMFLWMRFTAIPDFDERAAEAFVEKGVVAVPGRLFWADQSLASSGSPCPYMRVSFGGLSHEEIQEGMCRMAAAVRGLVSTPDAAAEGHPSLGAVDADAS